MASAMFGISYDLRQDKKLQVVKGQSQLIDAKKYYEDAKSLLLANRSEKSRWKIECGDKDLEWASTLGDMEVKSGKPNPESLSKAVSELAGKEEISHYQGLFYSKFWSPKSLFGNYIWKSTKYLLPDKPETTKSGFCASEIAITSTSDVKIMAKNYLTLCDPYFARQSLTWAHSQVGAVNSLDNLPLKAGILLHELMHMTSLKVIDETATGDDGKQHPAQTWSGCRALAKEDPQRTVTNADTYHYFALGVYFVNVNWWPEGYEENVGRC
ncbi:hypothetical protein NUU61_007414 [Penicillium alfredii]|uniref:Lysine-specific metallo-endopeptidase domain-containing protein n=1 Tax=Penicillium alfredii TaxID=1506179 RepID=A0A9W9F2U5_9EURO|nr:uncharacterized protein NUU61_007414 [Penicillium alfredii]KAJ5092544.1 hypothetical protein NUU61_007414 [Penicillium alfredii]